MSRPKKMLPFPWVFLSRGQARRLIEVAESRERIATNALKTADELQARVATLESAIRSVQSEHRPDGAGGCRVCSPWRCLVWLELDAVLPPEEEQG